MNKIEYPSQNNLYLNLEMVNGSKKVKINDEDDYHEYLNYGYKFTDDSQTTYNKRLATATEYNKPKMLAVRAAATLPANTRNPSAYLGRNRVRRDGVEKGEKHPEWKDWVEA